MTGGPPRIFFDSNDGSMEQGYWLGFETSKRDLAALGPACVDGLQVIIRMPDEFEVLATLRWDSEGGVWWGDPVPGTIRYLDGSDDSC
jgi:hypothetical protein